MRKHRLNKSASKYLERTHRIYRTDFKSAMIFLCLTSSSYNLWFMQAKISIDVLLGPRIPRLEGKNKRTSDAEALKQLDVSYYTVFNWFSIPFQEIKDTHLGFWPYCVWYRWHWIWRLSNGFIEVPSLLWRIIHF